MTAASGASAPMPSISVLGPSREERDNATRMWAQKLSSIRQTPAPTGWHDAPSAPRPMSRILIVDDDMETLASLAMVLAERHEVGVAADAHSALRRMRSQEFDLILLDLRLPDLKAEDVVQALRGDPRATPVLLMSGYDDLPDEARRLNVAEYLAKPFSIERLEASIAKLLGSPPPT